MKPITLSLLAIMALMAAALSTVPTDGLRSEPLDRSLLVGVWLDHRYKPLPGDRYRRTEFRENGRFRTMNPVGETFEGRWKWTSPNTISLVYQGRNKASEMEVLALSARVLVTKGDPPVESIRVASWESMPPR